MRGAGRARGSWLVFAGVVGGVALASCRVRFDDIPCASDFNCPPSLSVCSPEHVCTAAGDRVGDGGDGGELGDGGRALGVGCTGSSQCESRRCVDGVCCDSDCQGEVCQRCDSASVAGPGHCGFAAEGTDLDHECPAATRACLGACRLLTIASSCTGVSHGCAPSEATIDVPSGQVCAGDGGVPVSAAASCGPENDCQEGACLATRWWRSCDGSGACRLPGDHTDAFAETLYAAAGSSLTALCDPMGPSRCDAIRVCGTGEVFLGHLCDGAGACSVGAASSCDGYTCDTAQLSCKTGCATTADCAPGLLCEAPVCRWDREWISWSLASPKVLALTTATVSDSQTGLVWERSASTTTRTHSEALTYCTGLSLGGFTSGWRVPTLIELLSIVDPSRTAPAIDPGFLNPGAVGYWTSTSHVGGAGQYWYVDFSTGAASYTSGTTPYRARCVR